jgi:aspartyl protease family protein
MAGSFLFQAGLGLVAVVLIAPHLPDLSALPAANVAPRHQSVSSPSAPRIGNGIGTVVLTRSPDGKFYADAAADGMPVRFLIDTGATSVVLTRADAQRLGLGEGTYSAIGRGAGGDVRLRPVTLRRLAIGPLVGDAVPAMVAEDGLPVSLLGQSWLSQIGSVTIEQDRMTLR